LAQRIKESKKDIEDSSISNKDKVSKILDQIETQSNMGVSGKHLLLETVSRTRSLALDKDSLKSSINDYDSLSKQLTIKNPKLHVVGGVITACVAALLIVPTLGKSKGLIDKGLATAQSGLEVASRRALQTQMRTQIDELRAAHMDTIRNQAMRVLGNKPKLKSAAVKPLGESENPTKTMAQSEAKTQRSLLRTPLSTTTKLVDTIKSINMHPIQGNGKTTNNGEQNKQDQMLKAGCPA
jgi:hypothetical protein